MISFDRYNEGYKHGELEMFMRLTNSMYGKQCYFPQDNEIIYSRISGNYLKNIEEALNEFIKYEETIYG